MRRADCAPYPTARVNDNTGARLRAWVAGGAASAGQSLILRSGQGPAIARKRLMANRTDEGFVCPEWLTTICTDEQEQ